MSSVAARVALTFQLRLSLEGLTFSLPVGGAPMGETLRQLRAQWIADGLHDDRERLLRALPRSE
jgi:hypothetical protein